MYHVLAAAAAVAAQASTIFQSSRYVCVDKMWSLRLFKTSCYLSLCLNLTWSTKHESLQRKKINNNNKVKIKSCYTQLGFYLFRVWVSTLDFIIWSWCIAIYDGTVWCSRLLIFCNHFFFLIKQSLPRSENQNKWWNILRDRKKRAIESDYRQVETAKLCKKIWKINWIFWNLFRVVCSRSSRAICTFYAMQTLAN